MFIRGSKLGMARENAVVENNDELEGGTRTTSKNEKCLSSKQHQQAESGNDDVDHRCKVPVPTEISITKKSNISGSSGAGEKPMRFGDRVEAKYHGRGHRYYAGTILNVQPNGSCDIEYDDGDKNCGLSVEFIRRLPSNLDDATLENQQNGDRKKETENETGNSLRIGDRVEARYHNRGRRYYKGKITGVAHGLYEVTYDDGDKDRHLTASAIRILLDVPPRTSTAESKDCGVDFQRKYTYKDCGRTVNKGMSVDGEQRNMNNVNATVGSCEMGLTRTHTRSEARSSNAGFAGRGNRLHRGVVSGVKMVYLYEVKYDDGTRDVNIPCDALRALDGSTGAAISTGSVVDVLSWQDRFGMD